MTRTRIRRLPEKGVDDVAALRAILDDALVAHVGICEGGQPFVMPMACARDGETLLLHGSTASRLMTALDRGAQMCATVTLLDGLVYARSAFESSMHYRCAIVLGVGSLVPPAEKEGALRVLTDHLLPGRAADLRASTRKELAATHVIRLPLTEWSVKVSAGPPDDPDEDLDAPIWAGVLPLRMVAGEPVDAPDLRSGSAVPDYVVGRTT